ncbi:MAG: CinA family protein, partial [Malacoplasma sp.]|nr:CinA family protein [Malacoplasma sp.]
MVIWKEKTNMIYDEVVELCRKHNITLSTCESVTGGMIASYITKVSGASKVFKGGLVVYSNQAKQKL